MLAAQGASIVLVARRADALRAAASDCGDRAFPIVADMTERGEVRRVVDESLKKFGRVDVWVNNVGQGITAFRRNSTDDDVDDMIRMNVKSAVYGMQGDPAALQVAQSRT